MDNAYLTELRQISLFLKEFRIGFSKTFTPSGCLQYQAINCVGQTCILKYNWIGGNFQQVAWNGQSEVMVVDIGD